ncbi:hypothetical protein Tco_0810992, partial [Tanacetum coccineum]
YVHDNIGRGRGMGRGGGRGQGRSFGGGRPMQPPRRGPFAETCSLNSLAGLPLNQVQILMYLIDLFHHRNISNNRFSGCILKELLSIPAFVGPAPPPPPYTPHPPRTGFTTQVYELSPFFLHKEWIMEQWEKNYYISSIPGANNGSSLMVMSKGTQYSL